MTNVEFSNLHPNASSFLDQACSIAGVTGAKRYTNLESDQLDVNMKKRVAKGKKRDVRDMDYYNAIERKELGYMLPTESG
jgi:hypothetical protein